MNRNTAIALAVSALSALIITTVIALFSVLHMRSDMKTHAKNVLAIIVDIDNDAQKIWDQVSSLPMTPCSSEHLSLLRFLLKQSFHIKDIAYVENNQVLCSVVHGDQFPPQRELSDYTYIAPVKGAKIWSRSFWPQHDSRFQAALALREKHLLVVTDEGINRYATTTYQWNLEFNGALNINNIRGDAELLQPKPNFAWVMGEHQIKECLTSLPYCVKVRHAGWQYAAENRLIAVLTILVGYLFGWPIYTTTKRCLYARTQHYNRVARGLKHGGFFPLYQPIINLSNNRIIGVEVLARFKDSYGDIYPDTFIPLISQMKKTWEFTEAIINQSLAELQHGDFDKSFSVSVNFFPNDIASGSAVAAKRLESVKNWQGKFRIEITEDQNLDKSEAHRHLYSIAQSGIEIAIDDFGTGYSNLHAIDQLHCQYLKIDCSFVIDMEQGAVRASLIPHIIEIARQANLKLIAEGIENSAQAKLLKGLGVDFGQGYYYGKPMPAEGIFSLMDKSNEK